MKVQGVEHRGRVVEVSHESPHFQGSFTWQSVDPGFRSILAKTNRYQPNRRGWQLDLALPLGQGEVGVAMEASHQSRGYAGVQQVGLDSKVWRTVQGGVALPAYQIPDPAPYGRRSLWQFDAVNYVLRHDRELGSGSWSVRETSNAGSAAWKCSGPPA